MTQLKTFIIRGEHREALSLLTQEQKGILLDAMFTYNLDGESPELEGMVKMAFAFMKNSFDSDRKAYEERCERNRKNGKKSSGRPRSDDNETDRDNNNPSGSGNNPESPVGNEKTERIPENPIGEEGNPENPVGFSETEDNPEEPRKPYTNTNTKSYTNTKSNTPPYIPPEGMNVESDRDFPREWDRLRFFWNSAGLPEYKKLFINLSDSGEVKNWMAAYSEKEIQAAIANYRKLLPRIPPTEKTYDTFYGFIRSGIDRFHDGVKPGERYETPEEEKVSACAPEPLPEISEEEREEVRKMMLEDDGILGDIARRREAVHA